MISDEEVRIFERYEIKGYRKCVAAYVLQVGHDAPTTVRVSIIEGTNGTFSYENSHLSTAPGSGPYRSTSMQNRASTPEQALEFALQELLFHYEVGTDDGKTPSRGSFVISKSFIDA